MARVIRTKITLTANFGAPARVKEPGAPNPFVMGILIGRADSLIERASPKANDDGSPQKFEGLSGSFLALPSDPAIDETESGVLFMPDAFHNLIRDKLVDAKKADPSASIEFVLEVSSILANNPAGYSWQIRPPHDPQARHPLQRHIEALGLVADRKAGQPMLPRTAPKLIEAPRAEAPAEDAPAAPAAATGRRK